MILYFTDNHMLGVDYVSEFNFNEKKYKTLKEFIEQNTLEYKNLKQAVLARLKENTDIYHYFTRCDAEFYHITSEAAYNMNHMKNYSITETDCCNGNILGEIYNKLQLDLCCKKEHSLIFKDELPVFHHQGSTISKLMRSHYVSCHSYY